MWFGGRSVAAMSWWQWGQGGEPDSSDSESESESSSDSSSSSSSDSSSDDGESLSGGEGGEPEPEPVRLVYHFGSARPGQRGFNKVVTSVMRERGLFYGDRLGTSCRGGGPFAHTETAAWLVGPDTPIDRLLVVHRTGSGKTFAMIHILDRYFSDTRAKVVVFPRNAVANNFYEKLMATPSQYQAFAQAASARERAALTLTYFRAKLGMEGELHKRGRPGELAAPLRSLSYSKAGGAEVFPRGKDKTPSMPLMKLEWSGRNPFDNKIVLMDEVHNLVRPPDGADKSLKARLQNLRDALYSARNAVIVGLTATPFVDNVQQGRDLLALIKGAEFKDSPTNEGFISYFNALPTSIYPKMMPADNTITLIHVNLQGANLDKYLAKARERERQWQSDLARLVPGASAVRARTKDEDEPPPGPPEESAQPDSAVAAEAAPPDAVREAEARGAKAAGGKKGGKKAEPEPEAEVHPDLPGEDQWDEAALERVEKALPSLARLMGYCNMAGFYTQAAPLANSLRRQPEQYATKLAALAADVLKHDRKAAVLIQHSMGLEGLRRVFQGLDPQNRGRVQFVPRPQSGMVLKNRAAIAAFNAPDNARGEKTRVLVLDADEYGEGVDLLGVRDFYLAHPAPSYAQYKQWLGRVFRACGYDRLNAGERNVRVYMYLASTGDRAVPTADEMVYAYVKQKTRIMEEAMFDIFGSKASDRIVLGL
jgi:hypothetical protein